MLPSCSDESHNSEKEPQHTVADAYKEEKQRFREGVL
jgi:hypothetical protein